MISFVKPMDYHGPIKMFASGIMILGALLISVFPELAAESAWTFTTFLTVHIIWASYAIVMKEYALLWMNLGLLPIDFYAIGIRI